MSVYIVYNKENLNEVDPLSGNIVAFAVKDTNNNDHYTIYTTSSVFETRSDPRDLLKTIWAGDFCMFPLVALYKSSLRDQLIPILIRCQSSSESWPGNVLTEMKECGWLSLEAVITYMRNSTSVYHPEDIIQN